MFMYCAALLAIALMLPSLASGQENRSGALDFGGGFAFSHKGRTAATLHSRAMAVDRLPGTSVGRFGELYGSVGIDFSGELLLYNGGIKLGVGIGTSRFVAFLASGLMVDAYQALGESGKSHSVEPRMGFPLVLGLWLDLFPSIYSYFMAEPAWLIGASNRKYDLWPPFSVAHELKLRTGLGFDIEDVHIRLDYVFHAVSPAPWHLITIGFGTSAKKSAAIGEPRNNRF